jgi:hypothetical protein
MKRRLTFFERRFDARSSEFAVRRSSLTLFAMLYALCAAPLHAGENLIKNGNFDGGGEYALNWERADGLTSFFEREEGRGRIVKMDTQVERQQALEWNKRFKADPTLKAPMKTPIAKESFGTIGGVEGVMLDSDLIDVKPGQDYKLSVDFKGEGKPFVWIKGFLVHPRRKVLADAYQTRLEPHTPSKTEWRTFSIGFNPTAKSPLVTKMKVRLYSYWPNGLYYFDNVRVEEITKAEMAELVRQRGETH